MTKEQIVKVLADAKGDKSDYRIHKESGLAAQQIKAIHTGTINPTLVSLLAYCSAVGLQIEVKPV